MHLVVLKERTVKNRASLSRMTLQQSIQAINTRFVSINRADVIFYAKMIANKKYKIHESPKKDRTKFFDGWLTDLFKHTGVKSRHLYGKNSSVDLISANTITELKKNGKLLELFYPKDIMDFDETGLYYEQQPTRTICKAPMDGPKYSKNRLYF